MPISMMGAMLEDNTFWGLKHDRRGREWRLRDPRRSVVTRFLDLGLGEADVLQGE